MKRNPKLNYECVVPAVKHSGESVMIWGVWGWVKGAGDLIQDINEKRTIDFAKTWYSIRFSYNKENHLST